MTGTNTALVGMTPVRRGFTMAQDLLGTVVRAQAGSLVKGLMEGVMNSIDAKAKTVRITLTENSVSIVDDGQGIRTEEELVEYFEKFGTRHEDGDARFGRFRIGRAQLFCYGRNVWKTTKFKMVVDLGTSGNDFSYELEGLLNKVKGCDINIELYQKLEVDALQRTHDELVKYLQLMPSKIFLNGKRINKAPEERKDWTHEDDLAYYKVYSGKDEASGVMLYNNGAFVREMSRKEWGVHAVVCSKHALTLNSARTEVLDTLCPHTPQIQTRLKALVAKELAQSTRKLSQSDRNFVARTIADAVRNNQAYSLPRGLMQLKVVKDVHDRLLSFEDIFKAKAVAPYDWGLEKECLAVNRSGRAIVLSGDTTDLLETWCGSTRLFTLLEGMKRHGLVSGDVTVPDVDDVKNLRKGLNGESNVISDVNVPHSSTVLWSAMDALRYVNDELVVILRNRKTCGNARNLVFGDSSANLAWTDGSTYIALSRKHLLACVTEGIGGMHQLITLMVHEYCHDVLDSESHHHETLFYSTFHDVLLHEGAAIGNIASMAYKLFMAQLMGASHTCNQYTTGEELAARSWVKKTIGTAKGLKQELSLCKDGVASIVDFSACRVQPPQSAIAFSSQMPLI